MKTTSRVLTFLAFVWLGSSLGLFAQIGFMNWKFWAILLPFMLLLAVSDVINDELNKKL